MNPFPAFSEEIDWAYTQEKTLRFNESYYRDGFKIQASDFYGTSVLISVYSSNGSLLSRNISMTGDSMIINDELNITVLDVQERRGTIGAYRGLNIIVDQWAVVQTRVAGKPLLKVSVLPYQSRINKKNNVSHEYESNADIRINLSLKNEGKSILKKPVLQINSTLPLFEGEKLRYELEDISGENVHDDITVQFIAPLVNKRKSFEISAELTGYDKSGKKYSATDKTVIDIISPEVAENIIEIRKYISEKIFVGDIAVVSLYIKNRGSKRISDATLTENLPAGLEPYGNELKWNLSIDPYETIVITYRIKPEKPGIYYFMNGSSRFEYNKVLYSNSKSNRLIVTGPYVVLTKSASELNVVRGAKVTIKLEAMNIGDETAIVKLIDSIPENYSISENRSINISKTLIINPGKSEILSYTLDTNISGSFILPASRGKVTDRFLYEDDRYSQKINSSHIIIKVSEPEKNLSVKITPLIKKKNESEKAGISDIPGSLEPERSSAFKFEAFILVLIFLIFLIKMKN